MKRIDETHSFNIRIACLVGIEKAIILKDLYGWCQINLYNQKNIHAGRVWTYNSVKALGEKYPYLKPRTIGVYMDELERDGWIESGNYNETTFDRTKWYSIDFEKYDNAILSAISKKLQMDLPETVNGDTENCQPYHLIPSHTSPSINAREEISEPTIKENLTVQIPDTPDWKEVAKAMYAHTLNGGKDDWEFLKDGTGYDGDGRDIFTNWAGKANAYQLRNWKDEFRRLGTWMKNEARANLKANKPAQFQQPQPDQPAKPKFFVSQRRRT